MTPARCIVAARHQFRSDHYAVVNERRVRVECCRVCGTERVVQCDASSRRLLKGHGRQWPLPAGGHRHV